MADVLLAHPVRCRDDFDPDTFENKAALGLLQRFVTNGREVDGSPTRDRLKMIVRCGQLPASASKHVIFNHGVGACRCIAWPALERWCRVDKRTAREQHAAVSRDGYAWQAAVLLTSRCACCSRQPRVQQGEPVIEYYLAPRLMVLQLSLLLTCRYVCLVPALLLHAGLPTLRSGRALHL
jgi:hypothetical protein